MESDQVFNLIQGVVSLSAAIFLLIRIRSFPKQKDLFFLASTKLTVFAATAFIEIFTNSLSGEMVTLTGVAAAIIFACIIATRRGRRKVAPTGDKQAQ